MEDEKTIQWEKHEMGSFLCGSEENSFNCHTKFAQIILISWIIGVTQTALIDTNDFI